MSLTPSISTGSTSSSNTNPPMHANEHDNVDQSNRLYNDHQNYQTIFSNDSRFFDTSLHLYKSYRKLGYIQQANSRQGRNTKYVSNSTNTLRPSVNGNQNHAISKLVGSVPHQHMDNDDDGTLKPPSRRDNERGISQRSVSNPAKPGSSKLLQEHPSQLTSADRPWPSSSYSTSNNENDDDNDDDDEADIIITRL